MTGHHTFKKAERLKSPQLIASLFKDGQSAFKFPLKFVYKKIEKGEYPILFTVSVSKKRFKKAVTRNRIKRLVREAYRLNKNQAIDQLRDKDYSMALLAIYIAPEETQISQITMAMKKLLNSISSAD